MGNKSYCICHSRISMFGSALRIELVAPTNDEGGYIRFSVADQSNYNYRMSFEDLSRRFNWEECLSYDLSILELAKVVILLKGEGDYVSCKTPEWRTSFHIKKSCNKRNEKFVISIACGRCSNVFKLDQVESETIRMIIEGSILKSA